MADSCCIVELKETIQKLNIELSQSHTKISELDAKVREQEEENTRLTRDLKECEEQCRATQKRLKFAEQKLAQFSHKPQTAAQIRRNLINDGSSSCSDGSDSDEDRRNPISDSSPSCSDGPDSDDSPTHVRHSQIRRNLINDGSSSYSDGSDSDEDRRNPISDSSSSCSDGPDSDDSPTHVRHPQVNETNDDALYINSLPNEIILKIFSYLTQNQLGQIARLCKRWNVLTKCPVFWRKVNVKIFSSDTETNAVAKSFINRLPSCVTSIRLDFSKCKDLDLEELCVKLRQNCPHLKEEMRLAGTNANDTWFVDDNSFLYQLHVLNVGYAWITDSTFLAIHRHGHNLKELYVCRTDLKDHDLTFNNSVFPHLKDNLS